MGPGPILKQRKKIRQHDYWQRPVRIRAGDVRQTPTAAARRNRRYQPISLAVAYPISTSPNPRGISARVWLMGILPAMISALCCG